jgi:hypothetical protein
MTTNTPTAGSEWLLPVTLKHVSRNQKAAVTFFGFEHDEGDVLIPLNLPSLIPASRLVDLEAEVARWQQLYEDARHDLTKAGMEVERLREALESAKGFIKESYHLTGMCCCGDYVKDHNPYEGHEPVDTGFYAARLAVEQIDRALNSPPPEGEAF